ncbi:redoxin domain-containing protein, partial [Candidatus Roizmanbacteria bacterium]|nr:redoxin domain-containing protein [Candidatus Roizmanbacteria bacterium]
MAWLFIFAFLSGLVTIAAPCIWPVLPIVLSASATGTRAKPLGITLGIMTSFAFFTLTLSYLIKIIPFDPNLLRLLAVSVIGFLGLTLLIPKLNLILEKWVSRLSSKAKIRYGESGFRGGLVTGLSVGIVWSPCAGPILATIATLAATQAVSLTVVLVTIFYVLGVGVPLFLFAFLGNRVFAQSKIIAAHTRQIQKIFGAVMILTAIAIVTNTDKLLQVKLLDHFPAYSRFLYKFEGDSRIKKELSLLRGNNPVSLENKNKPLTVVPSTLPNLGRAPELTGVTKWLNTDSPLTLADLKGKVVLVDFWTYTCINCLRTLPHVNSWYEAYRDQGLVVIGVHTPEFEFEKSTNNVKMAIDMYKIRYPVAQDNDYATWNAYSNQY